MCVRIDNLSLVLYLNIKIHVCLKIPVDSTFENGNSMTVTTIMLENIFEKGVL